MGAPLHQYEKILLAALKGGEKGLQQLVSETGLVADSVTRAAYWLQEKKLASVGEALRSSFELTNEGRRFAKEGLPERRLLEAAGKGVSVAELGSDEKSIGIPWAKRKGWIAISGGRIALTPEGRKAAESKGADEKTLGHLAAGVEKFDERAAQELAKRGLARVRIAKDISVSLTKNGMKEAAAVRLESEENLLTRDMLLSGSWRNVRLRPYDIEAPVERAHAAKKHPLRRMIDRIRNIFVELGFEEASGPLVESSFWNFDALFQPQDHPARDLADTFYLSAPSAAALPDKVLVARVKQAHEKGWRYDWSAEAAKQPVLRTHTTAVSARRLAALKATQAKFFCVGRVFRNEATDYKHLAEFHQVEGIVAWEGATFSQLLGLLREFYRRMGFERIRFRPSYFPYTEPSLEIEAFFEEKRQWLELGGAGVFRPEVCYPLWGRYPVLAFGLSLERPAMLLGDLQDIRTFYRNDLNWIRNSRVLDGSSRV